MIAYALNTQSGLLLHQLLYQCRVALSQSACGSAEVLGAQDALIKAFNPFVLLGLGSLIFLFTIAHKLSVWFGSRQLAH